MNYELAKELKDNGFPMNRAEGSFVILENQDNTDYFEDNDRNVWWKPSLSELIEACGDRFLQISSNPELTDNKWGAYSRENLKDESEVGLGKTPEEAVSRLWLALNKK